MWARLGRLAELVVFPTFCKICGALLERPGDRVVCRSCLEAILPCRHPHCARCGRFFDGTGGEHLCGACIVREPAFSVHRSAGRYQAYLKDAVLLLKYRRYRPLGRELARFAYEALRADESLWRGADVIVPVPLHRKRRRERGFNQAGSLGRELARLAGLPFDERALGKVRNAAPQTSLGRDERAANVRGAYAVTDGKRVKGKVVLLVDDVYTTGATLGECARALDRAGAKEVRAVTLAQA